MSRPAPGLPELLVAHGVPEKSARLYLAACRGGPQTASELARLADVNRVEAYRLIQSLVDAHLLASTGSRPRRFAATPPEHLLDRWISDTADRLRGLERDRDRILAAWEAGRDDLLDKDPRKFTVLEGREGIRRFLRRRIESARREILVSATARWLPTLLDAGLDRPLAAAAGRGVTVRLVTQVRPTNLAEAKILAAHVSLRHAPVPVTSRTLVFDRGGALVFVSGEIGLGRAPEEQVALWSAEPKFVDLAREYHHRLWATAEQSEARIVELEEPSSAFLPVVSGREAAAFQRLKEITKLGMRASGVREVRLDLPDLIGAVARQLGREIAGEIEGSTPAEVARSLSRYYATHTMGKLTVERERPMALRVTGCFACTADSPEIGRELCPRLLRAVLETRLGEVWAVSKPDPTQHARRGCLFNASPT
ncbi:MAG TPA: TrmB family transcriptional regulator sugar-binding domain-containing protein [Thermoplasmata archaeon]|nr:TrmB family transcriptional regulator sugar-binding domain-containing protein [Thermoplasmata archaeon]